MTAWRAARRALAALLMAAAAAQAQDDGEALRRRLTERIDQDRPAEPLQIDLAGRPLTIGGELALIGERLRGPRPRQSLRQGVAEFDLYYDAAERLVLYTQQRLVIERERDDAGRVRSRRYVEFGEAWLHAPEVGGLPLSLSVGRLNFEDEQRWRWDSELDALRAWVDAGRFELMLALAQPLGRERSDQRIAPDERRVRRAIAQAAWLPSGQFALELYALRQRDRSAPEIEGRRLPSDALDEADARLLWLGAALRGWRRSDSGHRVDVAFEVARVRGRETRAEAAAVSPRDSVIEAVTEHRIRGKGFDASLRWTLPQRWRPRLYADLAIGSAGPAGDAADGGFRQTGLHANEADFGAVQRFAHYGALLDPELANLRIATLGAGLTLADGAASIDLLLHDYAQRRPAEALRDARIDTELDGRSRRVGRALDLVLAMERGDDVEVNGVVSRLRAGPAFGARRGRHYHFFALEAAWSF